MTTSKPTDHKAREAVRRQHDQTLFVEAGAGTGKTTELVMRVLELVAHGQLPAMASLAAITFTENAAAELRTRIREALDAATPDGVDVDFENAGGELMDHVLMRLNVGARVVLCGMISQYDATSGAAGGWQGQRNIHQILMRRATMRGFIVSDHPELFEAGRDELARLLAEGRLHHQETIVDGLEQLPVALDRLFSGANTGKMLVRLAEPGAA